MGPLAAIGDEVDRCVDVSSAVLGGLEAIRREVVVRVGGSGRTALEHEALFGRPEDRLGIEGVGEVDDLPELLTEHRSRKQRESRETKK